MLFQTVLLLVISGIAMVMDLKMMCVDNQWILVSLLTGCIWRFWKEGIPGLGMYLAGLLVPLAVLWVLFFFRMLGAGDIKVFCVLGGIMGVKRILICMLCSLMIGGVFSILILLLYGDIRHRIRYFINYIRGYLITGKVTPYYRKGMQLENIHFTVPIFLSVVLHAGGLY